jgi:hypothetical protein
LRGWDSPKTVAIFKSPSICSTDHTDSTIIPWCLARGQAFHEGPSRLCVVGENRRKPFHRRSSHDRRGFDRILVVVLAPAETARGLETLGYPDRLERQRRKSGNVITTTALFETKWN